ncbi:hypothetical protein BJ912DRAFT_957924 [Pholiota molesta]|nr:hypothetical protein BJ912DRAFT_957924 [Pholiota molesta]
MTALDALPDDIIWDITSKLHTSDNMCLRLVCRTLSKLVARFALSNLVIRLDSRNYLATMEKLKAYAQGRTAGIMWARTLEISGLVSAVRFRKEHELREDLSAALARLDLHTFRWTTHLGDPYWAFELFSRHLTCHPVHNLSLDFHGGFSTTFSVLDDIGHLQELTLTKISRTLDRQQTNDLIGSISKIIEHSPSLTRLSIHSGCWDFPMPTFHQFLTGNTILKLKTLDLRSLRITMDDITTPHFRSLDSLTIRYEFNSPDSKIRAELDELWKTLRREQIKLRRVETDIYGVTAELLKYLEYCNETLTDLLLCEDDYDGPEPVQGENPATIFYGQTLPQLADHLEVLSIQTTQMNKWCFGRDNAGAIGKCTRLKKLAVSVIDLFHNHNIHTQNLLEETIAKLSTDLELVTFKVYQIPLIA